MGVALLLTSYSGSAAVRTKTRAVFIPPPRVKALRKPRALNAEITNHLDSKANKQSKSLEVRTFRAKGSCFGLLAVGPVASTCTSAKAQLHFESGLRVCVCVCARLCIYIYIYFFIYLSIYASLSSSPSPSLCRSISLSMSLYLYYMSACVCVTCVYTVLSTSCAYIHIHVLAPVWVRETRIPEAYYLHSMAGGFFLISIMIWGSIAHNNT